jgi:hypothetical protein
MTTQTLGRIEVGLTRAPHPELKALVETYYDVQRLRVAGNNRLKALARGASSAERLSTSVSDMRDLEKTLASQIGEVVKHEEVYPWLSSLRGVGPMMAGAILASNIDPNYDKPSAWWRYAGVGIVDGKNQRKRRGQKLGYDGFLRRTLEVLVGQFLKAHQPDQGRPSFYAELYYRFRAESERDRQGLQPIHHHRRAIMLTQRVFLTHLQQRWREALGLGPPRSLYIIEREPGLHEEILAP